jgi:hypothetical protein
MGLIVNDLEAIPVAIVAGTAKPSARVYLPAGKWVNFYTNEVHQSQGRAGKSVVRPFRPPMAICRRYSPGVERSSPTVAWTVNHEH